MPSWSACATVASCRCPSRGIRASRRQHLASVGGGSWSAPASAFTGPRSTKTCRLKRCYPGRGRTRAFDRCVVGKRTHARLTRRCSRRAAPSSRRRRSDLYARLAAERRCVERQPKRPDLWLLGTSACCAGLPSRRGSCAELHGTSSCLPRRAVHHHAQARTFVSGGSQFLSAPCHAFSRRAYRAPVIGLATVDTPGRRSRDCCRRSCDTTGGLTCRCT